MFRSTSGTKTFYTNSPFLDCLKSWTGFKCWFKPKQILIQTLHMCFWVFVPPPLLCSLATAFPGSVCYLDGLIGVCDQGYEEAEHHVDKERDKSVQVNTTEQPHQVTLLLHVLKGGEHVISVDQGKQALGHRVQGTEL